MLIIGHRGAAGLEPENTIAAMQAGVLAGADMLEIDVRLTADNIPVVIHDSSILRTHHHRLSVSRLSLSELREKTKDLPVPTLEEVMDTFFGKVTLAIDLKHKGCGKAAVTLVKKYIKQPGDWKSVWFSSFHASELRAVRHAAKDARLVLLHRHNPFTFVTLHKQLVLHAVGFHQLVVNPVAVKIAKNRGLFTYAYTVNRAASAKILEREGIEGIVTNYPDRFTGQGKTANLPETD